MYDDSTHVRVRVLSSQTFPIKFEDLQSTKVEQDKTSDYLKASTYTKGVESIKYSLNDYLQKKVVE